MLGSRSQLVESIRPRLPQVELRRLLEQAARRAAADPEPGGRAAALRDLRALRVSGATGCELSAGDAAAGAVALADMGVRDEVATWALDRPDELLAMLIQVARCAAPPYDAPVCTVLAWVAYSLGDGALANVALERALAADPTYPLARLLDAGLEAQIPPEEVRALLRATRRASAARGQSD